MSACPGLQMVGCGNPRIRPGGYCRPCTTEWMRRFRKGKGVRAQAVIAERERCARIAEAWAEYYPEDVFPPHSTVHGDPVKPALLVAQAHRDAARGIAAQMRGDAQ